jgi:hypothetical protein
MVETNPYAAPRTDVNAGLTTGGGGGFRRSGALLITSPEVRLPPRCVKCNAPVDGPLKRKRYYWHHPAIFALVLFNLLIYAIVAVIVRRRAEVTFGLCQVHRAKRNRAIVGGLLGVCLSIGLTAGAIGQQIPVLALVGILGVVVSIVVSAVVARALLPTRIDKAGAQFKGCGEGFLASLPGD